MKKELKASIEELLEATKELKNIECKHKINSIKSVLKEFQEIINSNVSIVKEEGITRKATLQDHFELIQNEWVNISEKLAEMGIDLDED